MPETPFRRGSRGSKRQRVSPLVSFRFDSAPSLRPCCLTGRTFLDRYSVSPCVLRAGLARRASAWWLERWPASMMPPASIRPFMCSYKTLRALQSAKVFLTRWGDRRAARPRLPAGRRLPCGRFRLSQRASLCTGYELTQRSDASERRFPSFQLFLLPFLPLCCPLRESRLSLSTDCGHLLLFLFPARAGCAPLCCSSAISYESQRSRTFPLAPGAASFGLRRPLVTVDLPSSSRASTK